MDTSTPRCFAKFLNAFNLDRFGAGRHIIRDERGWRVRDIQAEYVWIARIRPSFSSPCFLALLKTPDGFYCVAAHEGIDGLPASVSAPVWIDLSADPVFTSLEAYRLELFDGGISLDGVSYTLSVRSFASEFDLEFSNPRGFGLSQLAGALWSCAEMFETYFQVLRDLISYGREYEYIKKKENKSEMSTPRKPSDQFGS